MTRHKESKKKLWYRPNTSDVPLIANILIGIKEYDIDVLDNRKFDSILDLGANIGLFTILYTKKYENKSYLAVEPENNNYRLLEKNVGHINKMQTLKSGVWYRPANLEVRDNGNNWGFTVEECGDIEAGIKGVDIDTLCEQYGMSGQLLIKMDIEGSEIQIFEKIENAKWISRTYALIIEIHDKQDGRNYKMICGEMKRRGFKMVSKGENKVFLRE